VVLWRRCFQLGCLNTKIEKLSGDLPITFYPKAEWFGYQQLVIDLPEALGMKRKIEYCHLLFSSIDDRLGIGEEDIL